MNTPASIGVDVSRVLCDMNSAFNPLHKDFLLDYHVSGARNGYVYLSIAMPEGMTRVFISLLESMAGFFRFIDIKARSASAQAKVHDPSDKERRDNLQADFTKRVLELFDGYVDQGVSPVESVKRTNLALKAENNPWVTYETVQRIARSNGRFRKRKGGVQ